MKKNKFLYCVYIVGIFISTIHASPNQKRTILLKKAFQGIAFSLFFMIAAFSLSCSGSSDKEKEEFTIIRRNDWQKWGLRGTPKEVLVLKNRTDKGEYYKFNTRGYLVEYGERFRNEEKELVDFPIEIYEYDADSITLVKKTVNSVGDYRYRSHSGKHRILGYTISEYDYKGDLLKRRTYRNMDPTSDKASFKIQHQLNYSYIRTDVRTYNQLQDSVLKNQKVYDKYHNPLKTIIYEKNGSVYKVLRNSYTYDNNGLMTEKIEYQESNYDNIPGSKIEPTPEIVWRYTYHEDGCLKSASWAPVVKLPEGWQNNIAGLDAKLFVTVRDIFQLEKDKPLVNTYPNVYDDRKNWTNVSQFKPTKFYIRRHIQYYDESGKVEPEPENDNYGC